MAPSNSSIIYVSLEDSSTGGGAYRSDDRGLHWRALSRGLSGYFIATLAVDPANPNIVYISTENNFGSSIPVGLSKSTDGGNTWTSILSAQAQSISISKSNPSIIYVGTFDHGIERSDDGGATWRSVTPSQAAGQPFNRVVIDPQNPNNVYEGNHGGYISWSLDGGTTWSYGTDMIRKIGGHAYMWAAVSDPNRDALLVGTCGRGIFINHLATAETSTPTWLKLQYQGSSYNAVFASNSTLTDLDFTKNIPLTFTLSGTAGTRAVSNITIPTTLLTGPYTVTLDGTQVTPLSTTTVSSKNIAEILVRYTQTGNAQRLVVSGTLVTPTVQFMVSYSIQGGGSGYSAPVLAYIGGGVQRTSQLSTSPSTLNLDQGTAWSITDTLSGSSPSERWKTTQPVVGTASTAQTLSFAYAHQYYVTLMPGSPSSGSVSPTSGWFNAGASVSISATPASGWQFTRWNGTGFGSYSGTNPTAAMTVNGPIQEVALFTQSVPEFGVPSLVLLAAVFTLAMATLVNKVALGRPHRVESKSRRSGCFTRRLELPQSLAGCGQPSFFA